MKAVQNSGVSRKIIFRGTESASSSSKGNKQEDWRQADTPPRVDAFDDFETREPKGDEGVDAQLA